MRVRVTVAAEITINGPELATTRSRRHSPDEAKQLIIERAVEFLWEHPFRDLTVAKLMVGTTLSRPAFYQYFDDLQGLAESLLIEIEAVMRKTANPWIFQVTAFATGAVHAPHHVPEEWVKKFHGRFDHGWDRVREATFERQKQQGIIPADTLLPPMPNDLAAWDSLPDEQKRLFRRQAEVFAAFMAHTDHHVGRLVQAIEDIGGEDPKGGSQGSIEYSRYV